MKTNSQIQRTDPYEGSRRGRELRAGETGDGGHLLGDRW